MRIEYVHPGKGRCVYEYIVAIVCVFFSVESSNANPRVADEKFYGCNIDMLVSNISEIIIIIT